MGFVNRLIVENLNNRFSKKQVQEILFFFFDNIKKPWNFIYIRKKYRISLITLSMALFFSFISYKLKNTEVKHFKYSQKTLSGLKKKYILILVTNSRKEETKKKLRNLSIYFDDIITSSIFMPKKPNTKMLKYALNKHNLKKNDVIFVGDSIYDWQTAHKIGIKSVIVFTGLFSKEAMLKRTKANLYINSIDQLPNIIKKTFVSQKLN